ncbi:MAG: right-handed parallel beta-helix repeat-containing protein [Candidatus Micrarchaeota archaeon]
MKYALFTLLMLVLVSSIFALPSFPHIGLSVIEPTGNVDVNQDRTFDVTLNVSCYGGADCGDINVSLDPFPAQCTSYTPIDWDTNSVYNGGGGDCSNGLASGWYRLTGTYTKIAEQGPYMDNICNTAAAGFLMFAHPTVPAGTTAGIICYDWSGGICYDGWNSSGIQITACNGYYVYYLTPAPVCSLHPCTTDTVPDPITEKVGLVSTVFGDLPFYTTDSNPQTINLNDSQYQTVSFSVNATGWPYYYTFFAYANRTADMSVSNQTANWTVTIYPPPLVTFISPGNTSTTNNVLVNISTQYFIEETVDSVWWNNGTDNMPYTIPVYHAFSDGTHTLTAYANDTDGNNYSKIQTLLVDTIKPEVNMTYPTNGSYPIAPDHLDYSIADTNLESCWYTLDNGVTNVSLTCGTDMSISVYPYAPGVQTWRVYANDTAGNLNSSSATIDITQTHICGEHISSSTSLTTDLNCSSYTGGSALIITGDNVVLNCNGHSLIGPGSSYTGIRSDSVNGTTIKNCVIDGFFYGVLFVNSSRGAITGNTFNSNYFGLYLDDRSYYGSDYNSITDNRFISNYYGFYLYYSSYNQIGRNTVTDTYNANELSGSCPFLFLWNGSDYSYYTDLAGESIGGSWFETPLYQAGIYELGDLKSTNGTYKMKVREVIPESDFFDEAKLVIVDVPEGYSVLNQWHNTYSDSVVPPKEFMTIKDPKKPITATDKYGDDVLADVAEADGTPLRMHGNEPNSVIVDFGNIDNPQYAKLVITGWSSYELNPELSSQKNLVIETLDGTGNWVVAKTFGKFTGDSRTYVFNVSGIVQGDNTKMRISAPYSKTTINVIDQVLLDDSAPVPIEVSYIGPTTANLQWGGATSYQYATTEHRHIVANEQLPNRANHLMYGNFTKYGDVKPLLGAADDKFAVMRHGDEVELEFSDIAPKPGMDRHVFLQADVMYAIKYSVKGYVSDSIEPMPFHGMSQYPYGINESYPNDAEHQAYRSEWNTRVYDTVEPPTAGALPNSVGNNVYENTINGSGDSTGLQLYSEMDTTLRSNRIFNVLVGIEIAYSSGIQVLRNRIDAIDGRGMMVRYTDDSLISDNVIVSDNTDTCDSEFSNSGMCGALFIGYSDDNVFEDNTLTGMDSYGINMGHSENNDFTTNKITSDDYAIYLKSSARYNNFLRNTIYSDYWVYDNVGSNYFNDSTAGNRYYFANGTGAWLLYNISDTNHDGWADDGTDLPFGNSVLGSPLWPNNGEDWHPGVKPITPPSSSSGPTAKTLQLSKIFNCSNGELVVSAGVSDITLKLFNTWDFSYVESQTDSDGKAVFTITADGTYGVDSMSTGTYLAASIDPFAVELCGAKPLCTSDVECSADKYCSNGNCVAVTGTCGHAVNHAWVAYACCADSDCTGNDLCQSHVCVASVEENTTGQNQTGQPGNETGQPTGPTKEDVQTTLTAADRAIADALAEGKDISGAQTKLDEADAAFAQGNYVLAQQLAEEARQLALNAKAAAATTNLTTETKPVQQPAQNLNWLWLLLGAGAVAVVIVGAAAYFLLKKPKYK